MHNINKKAKKFATKIKGFLIGTTMIPLMGVGAHIANYCGDDFLDEDYSLHNRFETAYSFKTTTAHKYYTVYRQSYVPSPNGNHFVQVYEQETDNYLASPWATYPAMLLFGVAGACIAAYKEEQKKAQKIQKKYNTQVRAR